MGKARCWGRRMEVGSWRAKAAAVHFLQADPCVDNLGKVETGSVEGCHSATVQCVLAPASVVCRYYGPQWWCRKAHDLLSVGGGAGAVRGEELGVCACSAA